MMEMETEGKKKPRLGRRLRRKTRDSQRVVPFHRRIYLLPSSLTLGNIFFGFFAIITIINNFNSQDHRFLTRAALALIVAAFLDGIDGKVAKLTKTTSEFGLQLDSLADVISFGLAPGILAYAWAMHPQQRLGWLPAFLFLMCGAIRLARFNVQSTSNDPRYFTGLPIPAAALVIVSMVLLKPDLPYKSVLSYIVIVLVYVLSFLMVSTFKYRSFKERDIKLHKPVRTILALVVLLIVIMHDPKLMIFLLTFGYALSGVIAPILPRRLPFMRKFKGDLLDNITGQISEVEDAETEPTGENGAAAEALKEVAPHEPPVGGTTARTDSETPKAS